MKEPDVGPIRNEHSQEGRPGRDLAANDPEVWEALGKLKAPRLSSNFTAQVLLQLPKAPGRSRGGKFAWFSPVMLRWAFPLLICVVSLSGYSRHRLHQERSRAESLRAVAPLVELPMHQFPGILRDFQAIQLLNPITSGEEEDLVRALQ